MRTILLLGILVTSFHITVQKPTVQVEKFDLATDETVTFTTPGYEDGSYPYGSNNFWEFHSLSTKQLQLNFESFDVEDHPNCVWDRVKITKGKCGDLPDIADKPVILCGDQPGYQFDCEAKFMCVTFHSDGVINRRGFNATVWAKPDVMISGSTETRKSSQSTSPLTPSISSLSSLPSKSTSSSTPSSQSSSITSQSPHSSAVTSFSSSQSSSTPSPSSPLPTSSQSLTQTSLPSASDTSSFSTIISETSWSTLPSKASTPSTVTISSTTLLPSSPTNAPLTSTLSLPKSPLPDSSSKSTTLSVLHSSQIVSSTSKSSTVSNTEQTPNSSSSVKTNAPPPSTTSSATEASPLEITMCQPNNNNVEFSNMDIISIRTPKDDSGENYPVNRHCKVTINNTENKILQMVFQSFKLEYNFLCAWDFVQVNIPEEETKKYCGGTLPELNKTNSQVINIVFHSDHIVADEGFVLHVFQINSPTTVQSKVTVTSDNQQTVKVTKNNHHFSSSTSSPPLSSSTSSPSLSSSTSSPPLSSSTSSPPSSSSTSSPPSSSSTSSPPSSNSTSSPSLTSSTTHPSLSSSTSSLLLSSSTSSPPVSSSTSIPPVSSSKSSPSVPSSTPIPPVSNSTSIPPVSSSKSSPSVPSSTIIPPVSSSTPIPPVSSSTSSHPLSSPTTSMKNEPGIETSKLTTSTNAVPNESSSNSTTKSNQNTEDSTITYSMESTISTENGNETSTTAANNAVSFNTNNDDSITISTNTKTDPTTEQLTTSSKSDVTTNHKDSDVLDICEQSSTFVDHPLHLVSPNFDQTYPPNSQCTMSLTAIDDIMLSVDMFDVETHSKCEWDHVELEYNASKIKFCGQLVSPDQPAPYSNCNPNKINAYDVINYHNVCLFQSGTSIQLKSRVIKLTFVSDYIVNKKGFKISILPIKSDQNTNISETSPAQPTTGGSSTSKTASETTSSLQTGISSSESSSSSSSKAAEFSTESMSTTSSIPNGISSTTDFSSITSSKQDSIQPDSTLSPSTHSHETITSSKLSSNPTVQSPATVVSNNTPSDANADATTQSYTEVTSPLVTESERFPVTSHTTLQQSSIKLITAIPTGDKTSTTSMSTSVAETTPKLTTVAIQEAPLTDACSGVKVISGETGYIESPGYHNNRYPKDSTCRWKITGGEKPKLIMIVFEFFDVEYSSRCLWDKVTIYEVQADDDTLKEVWYKCGNVLPTLLSFKKDILIEFTSDSITEMAGFRLKFFQIETNTDRTYTCNTAGMMPCLNETKCIPSEWWCDGMVDCMEDQSDESSCDLCGEDEIQCVNGTCIKETFRCDGTDDCPYGTDERSCVSILEKDDASQVYVNVQNAWFPLCNDDNVANQSDVICNAAGYRSSLEVHRYNGHLSDSYSKVDNNSDTLMFTVSSTCEVNKTVHLRCKDSDCGVKGTALRRKRIIGGELSGIWPWSVALSLGNNVVCGGSIISSEWVITAGHCVYDLEDNPQIVSIIAGVNDITNEDKQIRYVSEVINHPDYNYIFEADIALLRLQSPLTFSNTVQPICLPWDKRQFSPLDICYVTGYGVSDMRNYYTTVTPRYLRQGKTKIIDRDDCKKMYSHKTVIKDSMLCAGYATGGIDTCRGDSGGGLMCQNENGRWMLAGVISWGEKCGSTNRPGVYTNVVSFMEWIDEKTKPDGHQSVACNFEKNWCGYRDISTGNYIWTRKPGDKYVKGTVLFAAKTIAPNTDKIINASLLSPTFTLTSDSCLSLRIMFSLNSNNTVTVYGKESGAPIDYPDKELFRVGSNYPTKDIWNSVEINIPGNITQLMIVSHNDYGSVSGLGLDNITMVTGVCQDSDFMECDFDNADLCQYTQSDEMNTVHWAIDPSTESDGNHLMTGGDGNDDFGYSAVSQLISPPVSGQISPISHCLTFSYFKHTLSDPNTDLVVSTYIHVNIGLVNELANQLIYWSSHGSGTSQWLTMSITVPHHSFDHIVFEVRRKSYSDDMVDILLDDIRFTDGICV